MKRVFLIGALLFSSVAQQAFAEGAVAAIPSQPGCPAAFKGFHFGANLGYGVGVAKRKFKQGQGAVAAGFNIDSGVRGVDGGIGIGYTYRADCSNWTFGIAFDANWSGAKAKSSFSFEADEIIDGVPTTETSTAKIHTRLKNSLQLYGKFGYVIREMAMPYVALGWDNSRWETKINGQQRVVAGGETQSEPFGFSDHKRLNGFLWKAGVDLLATRHFIVGLCYTGTVSQKHHGVKPQYNKVALEFRVIY